MPVDVHKGSLFLSDYAEIVTGLSGENSDAAERFCDAVERSLELLSAHPQIGARAGFRHAPGVRQWVIHSFHN